MLDLDALNAFVVFAEKRNFTHAAVEIYISQPSLHIKIKKLADNLGVTLYQRIGKEIRLTEQGEARTGVEAKNKWFCSNFAPVKILRLFLYSAPSRIYRMFYIFFPDGALQESL